MPKIKKLGIWTEVVGKSYNRTEGIARVITLLLRELQNKSVRVVIACPEETEIPFKETCADLGVHLAGGVTFVTFPAAPHTLVQICDKIDRRAHVALSNGLRRLKQVFGGVPLKKALWVGSLLMRGYAREAALEVANISWLATKFSGKVCIATLLAPFYLTVRTAIHQTVARRDWRKNLAKIANSSSEVDVWWSPNPTWQGAVRLDGPLVTSVWDLVYLEHPESFDVGTIDSIVQKVLSRSSATISMSNYVREKHVVQGMKVPSDKAYAVQIPPVQSVPYAGNRLQALREIEAYCNERFASPNEYNRYVVDFPFTEVDYIFAASNIRPYKNYVRLAQAFEHLVRRKRMNLKLVVTGSLSSDPALWSYLVKNGLTVDVISVPNLPSDMLARFFKGARLSVMPSLFEGGFPLTFSESVLEGVPMALSAIPTVRELIPIGAAPINKTIFDPTSVTDMIRVMDWCLSNRDEALLLQQEFAKQLLLNTWESAAQKYLDVFTLASSGISRHPVV